MFGFPGYKNVCGELAANRALNLRNPHSQRTAEGFRLEHFERRTGIHPQFADVTEHLGIGIRYAADHRPFPGLQLIQRCELGSLDTAVTRGYRMTVWIVRWMHFLRSCER